MKNLSIPCVLVLLSGCGGGGGGDLVTTPEPGEPGTVPETLVEGIWETACLPASGLAIGRRVVVSVREGDPDPLFNFVYTSFGDEVCDEVTAQREVDTRGTFSEQLFEDGDDPANGIPIDLAVDTVLLTPRLAQVANLYNENALCGSTIWSTGVNQDISGCADETGLIGVDAAAPRVDYNRFLVDDGGTPDLRSDDTLYLGSLEAQTDPSSRPAAVDRSLPLTRRAGSL